MGTTQDDAVAKPRLQGNEGWRRALMARIWDAPLFLTKLEDQFARRDAGLKKPFESPKRSFAIADQRPDKTSPFDS